MLHRILTIQSYAISINRQAAISPLEVLRLAKRDLRVAPEHRKERKEARLNKHRIIIKIQSVFNYGTKHYQDLD